MDFEPKLGDPDNTLLFKIAAALESVASASAGGPFLALTGGTLSGNLVVGAEAAAFSTVRLTVQDALASTFAFVNNLKTPGGAAGSGGNASIILRSTTLSPYGWRMTADGATDQLSFMDEGVGTVAWIPAQAEPAFGIGAPTGIGVMLQVTAQGRLMLTGSAALPFDRLQFGGITNLFPALKRSATVIEAVLADDSGRAQLYGATLRTDQTTVALLPAAATAGAGARAFVTDSNATIAAGLGNTVATGGANKVPVYSDGTNWIIG